MSKIIVSICTVLLCIAAWPAAMAYREYYLHKKKPESFYALLRPHKWMILLTGCCLCICVLQIYSVVQKQEWIADLFRDTIVLLTVGLAAVIDGEVKKIPNMLCAVLFAVWVLYMVIMLCSSGSFAYFVFLLKKSGLGLLAGGGIMFTCYLFSRGKLGMGDVKLFAILGMLYGMSEVMFLLFYSCIFTAIICIFLVIGKKITWKSSVPMSPFILCALFLARFLHS